jgi:hypothetical protein
LPIRVLKPSFWSLIDLLLIRASSSALASIAVSYYFWSV